MGRRGHPERGFALIGAVFALVIIASLIGGAFFAARQEVNIGRSTSTYQRAFEAAEAGMGQSVAQWSTMTLNGMATGAEVTSTGTLASNGGTWSTAIRRLNSELFLIRTTGTSGNASRLLARLVRLQLIAMNVNAGLTTRGQLRLGGSSFIDGVDTPPASWGCPTTGLDTVAGVMTRDSNQITTSGCGGYNCVRGDPKIQQNGTINDSTFFRFGDLDWAELTAMATVRFNGNTGPLTGGSGVFPRQSGGVCSTANNLNWGEPFRATGSMASCYGYLPIIYVNGNLKLTGGRGQGILLVEGDLEVAGGHEFYGPVIVRGILKTTGTGGHFNGGVLAANVDLEQSDVLGNAVITYSSCAVTRALAFNSPGRELAQRSWVDIVQ